ncbi:MAG: LysM peptidoglycan-binding domain-containing protein [Anaerolineales bacterium]|nr:LysM peptidoglycan-binding domain-containing protein [Anaerolineales bacterium]
MKQILPSMRPIRRFGLAFMLVLTLLGALLPGAALAAPSEPTASSMVKEPVEWGSGCSRYYTVRFGDTLSQIAAWNGTTVQAIMQANGLWNPNHIYAGQVLCIPGGWAPEPPRPHPGNCVATHVVRFGETLSGIAAWYGVSPWALAQANGISNWNRIYAGQRLCIPSGGGGSWNPCQWDPCNPQPWPQPPPPPPKPLPPPDPCQWNPCYRNRYHPAPQPLPQPLPPQPCPPQPCPQPCPGPQPQPCPPLVGAWTGEYFGNRDLIPPPVYTRQDGAIAFDWGLHGPGGGVPPTNFSVRWSKTEPFDGGTYRFWATVDDGVRIWVDGQLVLDYWRVGPATSVQCDHYLSPGVHTIKVEYFQAEGVAVAYVKYARV